MRPGLSASDDKRTIRGTRGTAEELYDLAFLVAFHFVESVSREIR